MEQTKSLLAVAQYKLEKAGDGNEAIDPITSGKPLGQVDAIIDALREAYPANTLRERIWGE